MYRDPLTGPIVRLSFLQIKSHKAFFTMC